MTRVRVEGFTISLDGYGAGPNQDIRNPLGVGGTDLHQWLVPTRTFQRTLFGADGGTTGIDDDFGRLTGRARQPTEWMCALAADLTLSSNIFVRASSMSCTSLSRRSCWARGERLFEGH
jgi:hypothetical protein